MLNLRTVITSYADNKQRQLIRGCRGVVRAGSMLTSLNNIQSRSFLNIDRSTLAAKNLENFESNSLSIFNYLQLKLARTIE
jgi:hypothetical protein